MREKAAHKYVKAFIVRDMQQAEEALLGKVGIRSSVGVQVALRYTSSAVPIHQCHCGV